MKGFIEVFRNNDSYYVNLQNVSYVYPESEQSSTIVFNYAVDSRNKSLTVEHSYEELKAMITTALG